MKKAAVCLKNRDRLEEIRSLLKEKDLEYVEDNPDFVISLGGDGTFLYSERKYPGIPKLIIKDSKVCRKCVGENEDTILDLINKDDYYVEEELKIEGDFDGKKIIAVNDIILRNKVPNKAIRLDLHINEEKTHEEVIGDGVIIATPFGSTAYYHSITRDSFKQGIGVAFNNPTEAHKPLKLGENQELKITMLRGDAHIAYDQAPNICNLKEGESIIIKRSEQKAKIIRLEE